MNIFQRIRDRVLDAVGLAIGQAGMLGLRYPVRKYSQRVDGYLVRGSRQDAAGLAKIKKNWLVTDVVNLCAERDETALVAATGMSSLWIKVVDNTAPLRSQVDQFLALMKIIRYNSRESQRWAYVHCEAGQGRTGLFVACYRVAFCGWSNQDALNEAVKHGLKMPHQRDFILGFRP